MKYHIYAQDVCIGDVDNANSEDHALALYALRTGMDSVQGLTPVQVPIPLVDAGWHDVGPTILVTRIKRAHDSRFTIQK